MELYMGSLDSTMVAKDFKKMTRSLRRGLSVVTFQSQISINLSTISHFKSSIFPKKKSATRNSESEREEGFKIEAEGLSPSPASSTAVQHRLVYRQLYLHIVTLHHRFSVLLTEWVLVVR
jgi:hypothetical protein